VDYRAWQYDVARIGGRTYRVATKPGVFGHGALDHASVMLAEEARVSPGETVAYLNCGTGLFGAVAGVQGAARVLLADRNVLSLEAATRTLASNDIANGETFLSQGSIAFPPGVQASTVAIRVPHERLAWMQLLRDAFALLQTGGACYIAGASNEGVKPAARALEELFGNSMSLSQRGGHRVVRAIKRTPDPLNTELLANPLLLHDAFHEVHAVLRERPLTLFTRPGVFSWEHLDEATEILARVMELGSGESVLDLGCGAGGLGAVAGQVTGARVCLLDADSEAVRCATRTADAAGLTDYRAEASDVTAAAAGQRFDHVISNPPFHVGKSTELGLPAQFIAEAFDALNDGGRLQLVANRTLPYERLIATRFGNVRTLHDGPRFKVLSAERRRSA
jgi:16S rRNA (guanine1207-N2)-methyltransferase